MTRAVRIEAERPLYRILSRGDERGSIVFGDKNGNMFVDCIGQMTERFAIDVLPIRGCFRIGEKFKLTYLAVSSRIWIFKDLLKNNLKLDEESIKLITNKDLTP